MIFGFKMCSFKFKYFTFYYVQVCYVAFWDEITLQTQEAERHELDDNHMIGIWRVVVVRKLPFADQRLNGKIPKVWCNVYFCIEN